MRATGRLTLYIFGTAVASKEASETGKFPKKQLRVFTVDGKGDPRV
jgi:hypothetical protein